MTPAGFEPKISAGKRPQTYALDRAATGTGMKGNYCNQINFNFIFNYNQQDATILIISETLYMFQAVHLPIIRST